MWDSQSPNNPVTQRRIDAAIQQVRADSVVKTGRDLWIFGLLASGYAFVGRPDLPHVALMFMKLGALLGGLLYCASLYIGMRWRRKAQQLNADLSSNEED